MNSLELIALEQFPLIEPLDDLVEIIAARDRSRSGTSVPAEGLFLFEVKYPDQIKI